MSFSATGPHHCPKCAEDPKFLAAQAVIRDHPTDSPRMKRNKLAGLGTTIWLGLISENYSGTGGDIAGCPKCKKVFAISYGVVAVEEVPWEGGYVGE